jgi:hypothetical protein
LVTEENILFLNKKEPLSFGFLQRRPGWYEQNVGKN